MNFLKAESFFDVASFAHRDLFAGTATVWEALERLSTYIKESLRGNVTSVRCFAEPLPRTLVLWQGKVWAEGFEILGGDVTKGKFLVQVDGVETNEASVLYAGAVLWDEGIFIGPGAVVEPGALIKGPTIIGAQTEVRQGAYVRGKCLVGDRCVVGHTTEMKSSVMLNDARAGHFAYIGDSILGHATNLGAGTKLANLNIGELPVRIRMEKEAVETGLRKFGAVLGDRVETGCNSVTNPGTLLAPGCRVFPAVSVRPGYYPPGMTILNR